MNDQPSVHPVKTRCFQELQAVRRNSQSFRQGDTNASLQDPYDLNAPRMIVLVGIPGSGKSTFGTKLTDAGWGIRVSQDDLGTRPAVEKAVVQALKTGTNVIVDRCNFDKAQRKHWTDYAKARGSHVGVVVFGTPFRECVKRVCERTSHPTLQGEESEGVVLRMANSFVFPDREEGFSFCRVINSDGDSDRVLTEILQAD